MNAYVWGDSCASYGDSCWSEPDIGMLYSDVRSSGSQRLSLVATHPLLLKYSAYSVKTVMCIREFFLPLFCFAFVMSSCYLLSSSIILLMIRFLPL